MIIDILLIIVLGAGFVIGYSRGIVKSVFYFLSILAGILVALRFAPDLTRGLSALFKSEGPAMYFLSFLICLGLTIFLIRYIARWLERTLQAARVNAINKYLGGILLSAVFVFVYSVLLWFANRADLLSSELKKESKTYSYLEAYPAQIRKAIKKAEPMVKDFWKQSSSSLKENTDAK